MNLLTTSVLFPKITIFLQRKKNVDREIMNFPFSFHDSFSRNCLKGKRERLNFDVISYTHVVIPLKQTNLQLLTGYYHSFPVISRNKSRELFFLLFPPSPKQQHKSHKIYHPFSTNKICRSFFRWLHLEKWIIVHNMPTLSSEMENFLFSMEHSIPFNKSSAHMENAPSNRCWEGRRGREMWWRWCRTYERVSFFHQINFWMM